MFNRKSSADQTLDRRHARFFITNNQSTDAAFLCYRHDHSSAAMVTIVMLTSSRKSDAMDSGRRDGVFTAFRLLDFLYVHARTSYIEFPPIYSLHSETSRTTENWSRRHTPSIERNEDFSKSKIVIKREVASRIRFPSTHISSTTSSLIQEIKLYYQAADNALKFYEADFFKFKFSYHLHVGLGESDNRSLSWMMLYRSMLQ